MLNVVVTENLHLDLQVEINIQTDVINNEIQLLLSKTAMKKGVIKIDFTKDKINILEQDIKMKFTFSGQYLIVASKTYEGLNAYNENNANKILLSIENISNTIK